MVEDNLAPEALEDTPLEVLKTYREFLIRYQTQDYVDDWDFRLYMERLQKVLEDFDARLVALEHKTGMKPSKS